MSSNDTACVDMNRDFINYVVPGVVLIEAFQLVVAGFAYIQRHDMTSLDRLVMVLLSIFAYFICKSNFRYFLETRMEQNPVNCFATDFAAGSCIEISAIHSLVVVPFVVVMAKKHTKGAAPPLHLVLCALIVFMYYILPLVLGVVFLMIEHGTLFKHLVYYIVL